MAEDFIEEWKPKAVEFERRVPWMYLDTRGFLTIGIGHLIYRADEMKPDDLKTRIRHLWKYKGGPRQVRRPAGLKSSASTDPIASGTLSGQGQALGVQGVTTGSKLPWDPMIEEAKYVLTQLAGQDASKYQQYSTYQFASKDDLALDALFYDDANEALKKLMYEQEYYHVIPGVNSQGDYLRLKRTEFLKFNEFPKSAKMAIMDMMHQMGPNGFIRYPDFLAAVGRGNWKAAAENCPQTSQANADRNNWRKQRMRMAMDEYVPPIDPTIECKE